jgi:hypothetical protein
MRKNWHTAQITTLGTQQLHAKGSQFRWRLYAYSHLTSPHHTSSHHHASPSTSQQHSASFHQIPQRSESWGCTKIHLVLSTLIILVTAIIKNIHPSFHIPRPTSHSEPASQQGKKITEQDSRACQTNPTPL